MSVRAFAAHLGVAVASVSNWERRGADIRLRDETAEILDLDLRMADEEVRARFDAALADRRLGEVTPGDPGPVVDENVSEVLERIHRRGRQVDPEILRRLSNEVLDVVARYEELDHAEFVPELRRQRVQAESLIDVCGRPEQRRQLFEVACAASGVLGYVAVGQGRFPLAEAYCAEAFQLGECAERAELMAWARGLQSFCAYYLQDYTTALDLAVDGLRHAGAGPQSVRLAVNGAARAMGRLGDAQGVHRLVGEAQEMQSRHDVPPGIASSIGLGCYSEAQVSSNAATAYLSLGMPNQVRRHLDRALPAIDAAGSPWGRALVKIDLATAVTQDRQADLEQACGLVLAAFEDAGDRPVVSIQQRAVEFTRYATQRWGQVRDLDPVHDATSRFWGARA
ncbi:hypothetical protein [Frankia sp. AgB32]|uniref:hypothetical protein n=1 Tax=Frankia sp. AgB32 TaxID=631119 RepID=UPI00200E44A1|nr:hypothetical protein [Frankia sp. AgB32]MCK9895021.1 hypothetical protein [Frankia sp. AgB32]